MISGLHHIAILCSDRAESLKFYSALGFTLEKSCPRKERGDEILMMTGYGTKLELFVTKDRPARVTEPEAYGLRHIALSVKSIEDAVNALRKAGYDPEPPRADSMTGERMTFVKDPDGLPVELHE